MIDGRRVLVTGGSGVIGRELLARLAKYNCDVLNLDRVDLVGDFGDRIEHHTVDIAFDGMDLIREFDPHVILHLSAAFERSTESTDFWKTNWMDNSIVSHRLLDFAASSDTVEVFTFASSYLIYEPAQYMSDEYIPEPRLLNENDRVSPRNVCGAAKYYTERELDFLCGHNKPGMRAVSARIYRVYGCGSRDVVSRWVRSAIANETIELYNEENRFDYIYAGDVAEGLLQLTLSSSAQGVVNLGSGNARQVSELAAGVGAHFPEWFEKIRREGGKEAYERSCADVALLEKITGWCPEVKLEDGIAKIIEFEQEKGT
ncbi:NAD(P)-dependent oxidoreductase [Akkermansiaceae bacterium]|nr:NAD(P)-dependent oxidoreductase [bacterium]MDB4801559.1 NAD(P)-dependent oxidoreductase [Akkermansiaceae bacterium]